MKEFISFTKTFCRTSLKLFPFVGESSEYILKDTLGHLSYSRRPSTSGFQQTGRSFVSATKSYFSIPLGIVTAFFVLIGQCSNAFATTYFVDNSTGNDANAGTTLSAPWKTIAKATQTLRAGDTVEIRMGTYNEKLWPQYGGSVGSYITYEAYNGETVILNFNSSPDYTGTFYIPCRNCTGYVRDVNYVKLKGLSFTGNTDFGLVVYRGNGETGAHVIFEDLKVYGNGIAAIIEGSYLSLINSEIYNNKGGGFWVFNADHFYAKGSKFHHNNSSGCNCDGLNLQDTDYALIEDSEAYGQYDGFDVGSQHSSPGSSHIIFRRVLSYSNSNTNFPSSTTITGPITYENVVTWDNYNWGSLVAYENSQNVHIWNSIFDDVNTGINFNQSPGTMYAYNNIFNANTAVRADAGTKTNLDYSRIINGGLSGVTNGAHSSTGSVNFVDQANHDYHLTPNNPDLIDHGTFFMRTSGSNSNTNVINVNQDPRIYFWIGDSIQIEGVGKRVIKNMSLNSITVDAPLTYSVNAGVHLPWTGSAPDIGAYEYQESGSSPSLSPPAAPTDVTVE